MRLTSFGASGGTGRWVVEQVQAAGHYVTGVVSDPARLPIHHQQLQVVVADVLDPAAIQPTVAGADAVLSALGPRSSQNRSSSIVSAGTASLPEAMRAAGTSRLVVVSAAPVANDDHGTTLPYRLLVKPLLRALLAACTPTWR